MFRKSIKILIGLVALLSIASIITYLIYNEPLPKGQAGPEADALAQKMLTAINNEAYKNTRYLEWGFRNGEHTYKWDKALGKVKVSWDDIMVDLNLSQTEKSRVYDKGEIISETQERDKTIKKAIDLFNNDSFWLVAPFKVFDKGVERRIVPMDDGAKALLITYTSGGSTPGDSYLWELQPNGFPISFKLWVKIIPIGGLKATWDDWQLSESGAFLPKTHSLGPIKLDMGNVKAYNQD
ncbi:hypothetical protein R3X28_07430 [Maribacter sp. TH_r10]|uniref:hypothetical protein n=1 Tax=Maribacter sp. TH_r10 TaxID=3082086 RepID=UPI002953A084|nr:hypothetical protein [Maribacter sp. TH_r10]MDV7138701.1 hypothetical protein [Maribacter sp. TH_r10]